MNFIDHTFVRNNNLPTHPLQSKLRVVLADGRMIMASKGCTLQLNIGGYICDVTFVITNLQDAFDVVLGISFLKEHNPAPTSSKPPENLTTNYNI